MTDTKKVAKVCRKYPPPKDPPKPVKKLAKRGYAVERVTSSMRKECSTCEEVPKGRRLVMKRGGGRFGKTDVYCMGCGFIIIEDWQNQVRKLGHYLQTGEGCE